MSEGEDFALEARAPEGGRLEYFDGTVYCDGQPYVPDLAEATAAAHRDHFV